MSNVTHWQDSPYWARWLAQDASGEWYWFENEPTAHRSQGRFNVGPGGGRVDWARTTPCSEDWTLTKRRYGADDKKPTV